jgi:hypothetical protein
MLIAKTITIVVILLFFILGLLAFVSIATNTEPVKYTMYNQLDCPGTDSCPTFVDDTINLISELQPFYDKDTSRFCLDLISRIELNAVNDFRNLTKSSEILSTLNKDNIFSVIWHSDNIIWIAFRGTWNLYEWMNNFKIKQVSYETGKKDFDNLPSFMEDNPDIMVHKGFITTYDEVKQGIFDTINEIKKKYTNDMKICVTGHSLGAAIATILGLDLAVSGYPDTQIYSFASPRVGNVELSNRMIDEKVDHYRIINTEDAITQMPLSVSPNFSKHDDPFFYIHNGLEYKFTDPNKSISNNHATVTYINNINNIGT